MPQEQQGCWAQQLADRTDVQLLVFAKLSIMCRRIGGRNDAEF